MTGAYAKQPPTRQMKHGPFCGVAGCDRVYYAKGMCRLHWERVRINGTTERATIDPSMPPAERLAQLSRREGDCIVYTGHLNRNGYGQITVQGKGMTAHRLAYETHCGPLTPGAVVCHTCDNPPCINPDHLYAGTHADNGRDKRVRRRSTFGERNAAHRLTEQQVLDIDRRIREGEAQRDLATEYGVGQSTVSRIKRRESWAYLFEVEP